MQHPDRFICISYPTVDFLIPDDEVFTAVGMMNFEESMVGFETGIYNFDELAKEYQGDKRDANVKTMIVLKENGKGQTSLVTAQECKVCKIPLKNFSLFSDIYADSLKAFGILACSFTDDKIRYLIDVRKAVKYMEDANCLLEEI